MRQKNSSEKVVKDIRRATRRRFSAEEKIRIVLDGLRGEDTIAELCRREESEPNVHHHRQTDGFGNRLEVAEMAAFAHPVTL